MVQLNLLPDVKKEFLQAQRTRNAVVTICIFVSIIFVAVLIVLGVVMGGQAIQKTVVTNDIKKTIEGIKKGMVEYRPDKTGIVHSIIGKVSFGEKELAENYEALLDAITKAKPNGVKGTYIKGISISTTMGPGIRVTTK